MTEKRYQSAHRHWRQQLEALLAEVEQPMPKLLECHRCGAYWGWPVNPDGSTLEDVLTYDPLLRRALHLAQSALEGTAHSDCIAGLLRDWPDN